MSSELQHGDTQRDAERIPVMDLAHIWKCSASTVYRRADKYGLKREVDSKRNSYIYVPKRVLEKHREEREAELIPDEKRNDIHAMRHESQSEVWVEALKEASAKREELLQQQNQDLRDQIELLKEHVDHLRDENKRVVEEKVTLNNQLATTQNAIQLYKESGKHWESVEKRLEQMEKTKSWWKFWE